MVLVRSSVQTLWDPFKDLRSDRRHGWQSDIHLFCQFGVLSHPLKHAEEGTCIFAKRFLLHDFPAGMISAIDFNECNTSILTPLSSVSSNNNVVKPLL